MAQDRKFFIQQGLGEFCVCEIVRGGCRAVSPAYFDKAKADAALEFLKANPHVSRVTRDAQPAT